MVSKKLERYIGTDIENVIIPTQVKSIKTKNILETDHMFCMELVTLNLL